MPQGQQIRHIDVSGKNCFTRKCIRLMSKIKFARPPLHYGNFYSTTRISIPPYCSLAEVAQEHRWHPPKSLDSDENFKPEHALFCHKLRFVAIYALFEDLWAKKVPFWVKNSVSWARSALLHGIYCIFH